MFKEDFPPFLWPSSDAGSGERLKISQTSRSTEFLREIDCSVNITISSNDNRDDADGLYDDEEMKLTNVFVIAFGRSAELSHILLPLLLLLLHLLLLRCVCVMDSVCGIGSYR